MKKVIIFLGLIAVFLSAYSSTVSLVPSGEPPLKASEIYLPLGSTGDLISLSDLSQIRIKDFEALSGKKMKFSDKVNFTLGQRALKNSINTDGTFNDKKFEKFLTSSKGQGALGVFNIGGLLLGLFLSLIGVLIAYLITGKDGKKSRIAWAWIGAAISLVVWGAILI